MADMLTDQIQMVSPRTVMQWMADDEAVLIDVREQAEWDQGHIPGARLIPLSTFTAPQVPNDPSRKLVIHCRSGQRCGMASARLAAAGWSGRIYRMEGGILNWRTQGGPVET
jgi:rhodanese-related sulfurtransferase